MPKFEVFWTWDEAFNKFGFEDGDGVVLTHEVANALLDLGYTVEIDSWGMHNTTIMELSAPDGTPIIAVGEVVGNPDVTYGYDCPTTYLPAELVKKLNFVFGEVSGTME
jgi:hypothetical protein